MQARLRLPSDRINRSHHMRILIEMVDTPALTAADIGHSLLKHSCPLPVTQK
jgi:hypothetical protein